MAVETKGERWSGIEKRGYDYDIEHVPESDRKGTLDLCLVWFCWAVQFATIIVGGIIASGLPITAALWAIIVGDAILAVIAVSTGLIGRRVGLGFSMLSRYPFGHWGSKLPSLMCGIVQLGWLTFCYWIFANAVQTLIGLVSPTEANVGFVIGILVATVITIIPTTYGFQGPKWVAYINVPFIIIPSIYVIWTLLGSAGGYSFVAANYVPKAPISWASGVMLAMGAWLFGATTSPDFMRLGKSDWAAYLAPPIGLIVGESIVLALGAITTASTMGATWNPIEATAHIGVTPAVFVIILYLAAMWSTNVPTAWSSSLQFANLFERPKTYFAIGLCLLAPILGSWIQFSVGANQAMNSFLNFLSSIIPPVGGIIVAEYWLVSRQRLPLIRNVSRLFNPTAYAVWVIAALLNNWTNNLYHAAGPGVGLTYGIPGLNGFIIAIVIYWALESMMRSANMSWARLSADRKG